MSSRSKRIAEIDESLPIVFDTSYNPVGLFNFTDPENWGQDYSGNENHLTASGDTGLSGSGRITDDVYTQTGTSVFLASTSNSAPFRTTGSFTMEAIIYPEILNSNGLRLIVAVAESTESEADNVLYSIWLDETAGVLTLLYNQEHGGGTNNLHQTTYEFEGNAWNHIAVTRDENGTDLRIYHNGVLVEETTLANAATGGSNGRISISRNIPGALGYSFLGRIESVKLFNYKLEPYQIAEEYYKTFKIKV